MESDEILKDLIAREAVFHWPEMGTSVAELEEILAQDFFEIGASGRRWTRAEAVQSLLKRSQFEREQVWECAEFECLRLSEETCLLTYTLLQDGHRLSRRTTIWTREGTKWKALFHQGTIVAHAA